MRFWGYWGVDSGEASPSSKKLIMEILKFSLISLQVFSMSFSYFFAGLFLLFGLWLGVARSYEFKHWTIFIFEFSF